MKKGSFIGGVIITVLGIVWMLQGMSIMPGSYMSGKPLWIIVGLMMIALGVRNMLRARRPS